MQIGGGLEHILGDGGAGMRSASIGEGVERGGDKGLRLQEAAGRGRMGEGEWEGSRLEDKTSEAGGGGGRSRAAAMDARSGRE